MQYFIQCFDISEIKITDEDYDQSLNVWKYKYVHSEKIFDWIKKIIFLNHFLWCKEMFCLNETKFVWLEGNIFGPNKYLFESNKFLP